MKDSIVNELITAMKDRLPPGQNLANFLTDTLCYRDERRCTAGFGERSLLRLMRLRKFPISWGSP